jgi:hypothetical protein
VLDRMELEDDSIHNFEYTPELAALYDKIVIKYDDYNDDDSFDEHLIDSILDSNGCIDFSLFDNKDWSIEVVFDSCLRKYSFV